MKNIKRTNLKEARITKGWTLQHIADELNVSVPTCHNWETGKRNPNWKHQQKLKRMFSEDDSLLEIDE